MNIVAAVVVITVVGVAAFTAGVLMSDYIKNKIKSIGG